jgi:hypothetical protein
VEVTVRLVPLLCQGRGGEGGGGGVGGEIPHPYTSSLQ